MKGEDDGERISGTGDCVHGGVCRDQGAVREADGYRQTVEWLTEATGGKAWMTVTDISRLLGVDRHTVTRRFGITKGCALPILAMKLAQESK